MACATPTDYPVSQLRTPDFSLILASQDVNARLVGTQTPVPSRDNLSNAVKEGNVSGSGPESDGLKSSRSPVRFVSWPSSDGTGPLNRFPPSDSHSRLVSCPSSGGIRPLNWLT